MTHTEGIRDAQECIQSIATLRDTGAPASRR
jgi:hypothetical protein